MNPEQNNNLRKFGKWCEEHRIWYDRNLDEWPEHHKEREQAKLSQSKRNKYLGKQSLESLGLRFKPKKKYWWNKK